MLDKDDKIANRKKSLKEGLIGSAEEKLDGEVQKAKMENKRDSVEISVPSTVDAFDRKGSMSIGGPFSRRRVRAKGSAQKSEVTGARRGVYKIWDDRPIKNVGDGVNSFDVKKQQQKGKDNE